MTGTDSKTGKIKATADWIKIRVPAIIDQELFDQTIRLRAANSPKKSIPRRDPSPCF
jgi:hypothetical protein